MNFFKKYYLRYQLLLARRARELKQYKRDRENIRVLKVPHERFWQGGHFYELYTKQNVALKNGDHLSIITNQNLSHDTSIEWDTTGAQVRSALRCGQLNPSALTAKVIKSLGGYQKKCLDRKIKSRIESFNKNEKAALLADAQNQVEQLQPLELFLGHRVHDVKQVFANMAAVLDDYERNLNTLGVVLEGSAGLTYQQGVRAEAQAALASLRNLLNKHRNDAEWLETHGYEEILLFIKKRILAVLRQTQALNQILTQRPGSRAFLRGDLNNFIEDAVKLTRDHAQDLHNPVTNDDQLAYPPEMRVVVDSDYHSDGGIEELEDLLLCVSEISGGNNAGGDDEQTIHDLKGAVVVTSATKWRHWHSFFDSNPYKPSWVDMIRYHPQRFLGYVLGTLWNWLLVPFNLLEVIILGDRAGWFISKQYTKKTEPLGKNTNYYALIARIKERTWISTKVGLIIHRTYVHLAWDGLILGIYDGLKYLLRLPQDIYADFHRQESTVKELLNELLLERNHLRSKQQALQQEVEQEYPEEKPAQPPQEIPEVYYAQPEIMLTPYHSHGLLNSGVDGITGFIDLFGHHMFAKHPFVATASSFGAATSFVAYFAPTLAATLWGNSYVQFLLAQGGIWSKDLVSASFAGSFTNFKLIGATIEGVMHGPDSWLSKGFSYALKDPAAVIAYTTMSWITGYALVEWINLPGISATLRAHIGYPPALSETFAGAKFGIVGYHLLSYPLEASNKLRQNSLGNTVQLFGKLHTTVVTSRKVLEFNNALQELVAALEELIQDRDVHKVSEYIDRYMKVTPQEKDKIILMLFLALNKSYLADLNPVLKAKLQHQLETITGSNADARALEKILYPDKHQSTSTLRSFIGRIVGYIPVLIRCLLSPLILASTFSLKSAYRPWYELSKMWWDDMTSTLHAVVNFTHKILETVFNRLPRTLADVIVNGLFARIASLFGYHQVTLQGYQLSANWDMQQEALASNTTQRALNAITRMNTTPNPEVGLRNGIKTRLFNAASLFQAAEGSTANTLPRPASPTEASRQTLTQ